VKKALTQSLPGAVVDLRRRLDAWRRGRAKLGPIPPPLWNEAASLARVQGVHPIARSLGLDYNALKRHARVGSVAGSTTTPVASSAFVELALVPSSPAPAECTAELERGDGARMRVKLARREDLLALAESFWRWRA
jgi:hypothetical protein